MAFSFNCCIYAIKHSYLDNVRMFLSGIWRYIRYPSAQSRLVRKRLHDDQLMIAFLESEFCRACSGDSKT